MELARRIPSLTPEPETSADAPLSVSAAVTELVETRS